MKSNTLHIAILHAQGVEIGRGVQESPWHQSHEGWISFGHCKRWSWNLGIQTTLR